MFTVADLLAHRSRRNQPSPTKTPIETLREIRRRDPDGDETRTSPPTLADIGDFEHWIWDTYGPAALTDYYGDWDPERDNL